MYGRDSQCPQCPIRGLEPGVDSHVTFQQDERSGEFVMLRAERAAPGIARVSSTALPQFTLRSAMETRLQHVADRGALSPRERAVLHELVLTSDAIGVISERLGVRASTVKFHVNNILKKLGADSRIDLLRLML
jgi:DNA-binding NarL/FixJ family response regulator